MHSAPAVRYPVPRPVRAGHALAALCTLPAIPCLYGWMVGMPASSLVAIVVAWLAAAGACRLQWRGMHAGQLRWDGLAWWWLPDAAAQHDEYAVSVGLRLDLQATVLVRLAGAPGTTCWRWLERSAAPTRWDEMRRALHQRGAQTAHVPERRS